MKKLIFFLLAVFLLGGLLFTHSPLAFSSSDVVTEKINPGDDYKFIVKRLKEKVKLSMLFVSSKRKEAFLSKLVEVRLSELKYVVERKDIANFQTASQRYSATAGNVTDFVLKKGTKEDKEELVSKFQSHIPVLLKLEEPYIPDNSQWRFLQDNINSLQSYISKLSE